MNEDRATRYHRRQRGAAAISAAISGTLLVGLLITPGSVALRELARALLAAVGLSGSDVLLVASYVVLLGTLHEVLMLPLGLYRAVLDRRYGLSSQRLGGWLRDHATALAVGLCLGLLASGALYGILRLWPDRWWLTAGVLFSLALVSLTHLGPIVLLPLFHRFAPLGRAGLSARLESLARNAGTAVIGVYEWKLGAKSRRANAALVGLFGTRRIVISDTLLQDYSDDEIEIVLAHELGHHVHGDMWTAIALESAVTLCGFYVAHRLLTEAGPSLGVQRPSDIAGLPIVLLALGICSLVTRPFANALSRHHERRADRYALAATGKGPAFISAMRRLGAQNLAEESPPALVRWLFLSHPPVGDRIALARAASEGRLGP